MKNKFICTVNMLLLMSVTPVLAGQASLESVTAQGQRSQMQMEYRGEDRVRLNMPGQQNAFMLIHAEQAYVVTGSGGQTQALRFRDFPGGGFNGFRTKTPRVLFLVALAGGISAAQNSGLGMQPADTLAGQLIRAAHVANNNATHVQPRHDAPKVVMPNQRQVTGDFF